MLSSFHPLRENFILATFSTPSHLSIHFLYPSLLFQVEHTWWNAIAVRRKGSCVVLGHCYSSMETSSDISESHLIPWSCNFVLSYFIIIAPRWSQFPVTFFFPFLYTLFFFSSAHGFTLLFGEKKNPKLLHSQTPFSYTWTIDFKLER